MNTILYEIRLGKTGWVEMEEKTPILYLQLDAPFEKVIEEFMNFVKAVWFKKDTNRGLKIELVDNSKQFIWKAIFIEETIDRPSATSYGYVEVESPYGKDKEPITIRFYSNNRFFRPYLQSLFETLRVKLGEFKEEVYSQEELWKVVPDKLWYREAARMWWNGATSEEIARRVGRDSKTVSNRIILLRKEYGEEIIPYRHGPKTG